MMSYSTKEVTGKFNFSMQTFRYYEEEGLLPLIKRDKKMVKKKGEILS